MNDLLISGLLIGAGATLAMDIWALLLFRLFALPIPNWAMVGRWFWNLSKGRLFHKDILTAPAHPKERAIGWIAHYAVGILYGIAFALLAGPSWFQAPAFLPAWGFALVTISAGWFLLQPGMGLGWAAAKTPNPWKVRILGLLAHTVFGLGLWATALIL